MSLLAKITEKFGTFLCPAIVLPEVPFRPAKTIDLTARTWGRNYDVVRHEDGGRRLKVAMWLRERPEVGDYLILADDNRTTRYRIESVEWCHNPSDMYFADLSFAPRMAVNKTAP